ncbi:DUF6976 family protein [Tropicibacter naphthalenivorans]|uniref:Uncharacterized protein n=1 Tax=Tropicibacter naphthalenivorans TaxID=441103 RepID=A0A0N7M002_9RHOB|nr:hypothetical protein [Tropicibacter naphthalenivorans]CUH79097.1 hypothetical protein TRN7648_02331 [Tropicibacter naphthalenivorans]SMD03487.1 hypothetical protein SAMN04488093_11143 [Tropicibacter naphthalenivorans]
MKNSMMSVADAARRIEAGAVLSIAGSEEALSKLPRGKWIGGTSVYFMTDKGGVEDRENVFVTEIEAASDARVRHVEGEDLPMMTMNRFENGMSMILIPAFSKAHTDFALNGAGYAGLFDQPLMGWIAGVHLDDLGTVTPKIFDGGTGKAHEDGAILLHVELPEGKMADIDIVNLFEQDADADEITFAESGFHAKTAMVNGQEVDLAGYIADKGLDTALPLVANYAGAMINVSFQNVDADNGVDFYAPVVSGVSYRLAKSPGAYADVFAQRVTSDGQNEMSCNCILNYLYGEMAGKTTGNCTGPVTFGEVAYILLNQTMVQVKIQSAEASGAQVA